MNNIIKIWRLLSAEWSVMAFELCHPPDIRRNNLPNDSQLNKTHNTYLDKTVIYSNQLLSIVSLVQFTLGSLHWPDFCDGMSSKTGSLSSCWLRQPSQYEIKDSGFGFRFCCNVIFQLGLIPSFSVAFVSWDPILLDMYRDSSEPL